jgi:hypothetical protein
MVCRWMPWPITTSITQRKRALSQNGTRTRFLPSGAVGSSVPNGPGALVADWLTRQA